MARILVIDDDVAMCETLSLALEDEGHVVTKACDGTVALSLFPRSAFDLIVVDLVMPGKEGIETIIELKRLAPAARILAISGSTGPARGWAYVAIAAKLGAHRSLVKPFTMEEFVSAVQAELRTAGEAS